MVQDFGLLFQPSLQAVWFLNFVFMCCCSTIFQGLRFSLSSAQACLPCAAMVVSLEGVHKEWEAHPEVRRHFRESRRLFEGVKAGDHNPKCHVAAAAANKNVLMPLMRRMGAAMGQLFSIGMVEKELLDKMWDALKYVF